MFKFLFSFFKSKIKKNIVKKIKKEKSRINTVKEILKSPKKVAAAKKVEIIKKVNKKVNRVKKIRKGLDFFTPRRAIKREVVKNTMVLNGIAEEANRLLEKTSQAKLNTSEISKEVRKNEKWLERFDTKNIEKINNTILKELKGVGVESQKDIAKVIEDEEFYKKIVKRAAYDEYMNHWKTGLLGYAPERLGMSSNFEMMELWDQIQLKQTFEHVASKKWEDSFE